MLAAMSALIWRREGYWVRDVLHRGRGVESAAPLTGSWKFLTTVSPSSVEMVRPQLQTPASPVPIPGAGDSEAAPVAVPALKFARRKTSSPISGSSLRRRS